MIEKKFDTPLFQDHLGPLKIVTAPEGNFGILHHPCWGIRPQTPGMRSKKFSKIACDSVGREGVGALPPNPWPGSTTIFKNGLLRCRESGEIVHMAYL